MKGVLKAMSLLLGLPALAVANGRGDEGTSYRVTATGFNLGVELGASNFKNSIYRKKQSSTETVTAKTDDSSDDKDDKYNANTTKTGFSGTLFVGYNQQIGALVLGTLADFGFQYKANPTTRLVHREDKTSEESKLQRKYSVEFKLRAGVNLGGPVLFVNCGTIVGKYLLERVKFDSSGKKIGTSSSKDSSSSDEDDSDSGKKTSIKPSWLLGVDLEVPLSSSFFVKVGVQRVFLKDVKTVEKSEFKSSEWMFKGGLGCRL